MIDIGHPAHVHLYKNLISDLKNKGHDFVITSRDKEVTLELLNKNNIDVIPVGKIGTTKIGLIVEWILREIKILHIAKQTKPDLFIGVLNPCMAHCARLHNKKSIIFNDSEVVNSTALITYPFADVIITPSSFLKNIGPKQIQIDGYKELAYLHPNHFRPNEQVLDHLDVQKGEKFVIIRFVGWRAGHDLSQNGFTTEQKIEMVNSLNGDARILISSEEKLPPELEYYRISIPPEMIHDALYYATLFIGDSQTMTTEAGILGTPAIRCNSFVGDNDMGNFIELENKYSLIYNIRDPDNAIELAKELLMQDDIKSQWSQKQSQFLNDKIDVTDYLVKFIEKMLDEIGS